MKRFAPLMVATALLLSVALTGCTQTGTSDRLKVVSTIFPQYDWVRQILGDNAENVELTLLLDRGIDMHSYQPTVDDIFRISSCDLFIYVGGESDGWVQDALIEASNPEMVVINMLEVLGDAAQLEEIVEGVQDDHDHEDDEHPPDDHGIAYDEHVWLSLKNAQILCAVITDALSSLDAPNAELYRNNLASYTQKLSVLDAKYRDMVNAAPVKTLLFGDRFPFLYLVKDYGLQYYPAFPGCSTETRATFGLIISLVETVDKLGLKTILVTESSDGRIAQTIISESKDKNQQILVLDSIQSVGYSEMENGATYLTLMAHNLDILEEALR